MNIIAAHSGRPEAHVNWFGPQVGSQLELFSGSALANRRPCSNFLSFLLPSPFSALPSSRPLKTVRGLGEHCNLPQQSPSLSRILLHCMLAKRIWLQH